MSLIFANFLVLVYTWTIKLDNGFDRCTTIIANFNSSPWNGNCTLFVLSPAVNINSHFVSYATKQNAWPSGLFFKHSRASQKLTKLPLLEIWLTDKRSVDDELIAKIHFRRCQTLEIIIDWLDTLATVHWPKESEFDHFIDRPLEISTDEFVAL